MGTLEVKLVQARDLTNKDLIGKSDPFATLYIRPLPDKTKRSKTIVSLLNPFLVWALCLLGIPTNFRHQLYRTMISIPFGMNTSSLLLKMLILRA